MTPARDDPVVKGLRAARQTYRPGTILRMITDAHDSTAALPEVVRAQLQSVESAGRPLAFLCVSASCARPTSDPTELRQLLLGFSLKRP